jgi:hypothetical protein
MNWKRLLLEAFGFGAGFAICAAVLGGLFYWNSIRPKPWNKTALKASFSAIEFDTQPQAASYKVVFSYDVQNTTQQNYEFQPSSFTFLAVLADGNSLSKEFGHYQAEEPRIDGPAFIPTQGKVRVQVIVSYDYPPEWTTEEKGDQKKVNVSLDRRLRELSGFVAYDKANHYEIDLPEGWRNWDDVKSQKD